MNKLTKLTLSMPSQVLKEAKSYARIHKTSISSIVTKLFESFSQSDAKHKNEARTNRNVLFTDSSLGLISLPQKTDKAQLISDAVSEKFRKR